MRNIKDSDIFLSKSSINPLQNRAIYFELEKLKKSIINNGSISNDYTLSLKEDCADTYINLLKGEEEVFSLKIIDNKFDENSLRGVQNRTLYKALTDFSLSLNEYNILVFKKPLGNIVTIDLSTFTNNEIDNELLEDSENALENRVIYDRLLTKEDTFDKNSAFNKNFGFEVTEVPRGNSVLTSLAYSEGNLIYTLGTIVNTIDLSFLTKSIRSGRVEEGSEADSSTILNRHIKLYQEEDHSGDFISFSIPKSIREVRNLNTGLKFEYTDGGTNIIPFPENNEIITTITQTATNQNVYSSLLSQTQLALKAGLANSNVFTANNNTFNDVTVRGIISFYAITTGNTGHLYDFINNGSDFYISNANLSDLSSRDERVFTIKGSNNLITMLSFVGEASYNSSTDTLQVRNRRGTFITVPRLNTQNTILTDINSILASNTNVFSALSLKNALALKADTIVIGNFFQRKDEKNIASGYVGLNANSKIDTIYLPDINTFATLDDRTITFPDNSSILIPTQTVDTNTFATLDGRIITFANGDTFEIEANSIIVLDTNLSSTSTNALENRAIFSELGHKENAFDKNSAFNKNFGFELDTVAQGSNLITDISITTVAVTEYLRFQTLSRTYDINLSEFLNNNTGTFINSVTQDDDENTITFTSVAGDNTVINIHEPIGDTFIQRGFIGLDRENKRYIDFYKDLIGGPIAFSIDVTSLTTNDFIQSADYNLATYTYPIEDHFKAGTIRLFKFASSGITQIKFNVPRVHLDGRTIHFIDENTVSTSIDIPEMTEANIFNPLSFISLTELTNSSSNIHTPYQLGRQSGNDSVLFNIPKAILSSELSTTILNFYHTLNSNSSSLLFSADLTTLPFGAKSSNIQAGENYTSLITSSIRTGVTSESIRFYNELNQTGTFFDVKIPYIKGLEIIGTQLRVYINNIESSDRVRKYYSVTLPDINTFATLDDRTITFTDNSTITIPTQVTDTNTFATLDSRTITFPDRSSITIPEATGTVSLDGVVTEMTIVDNVLTLVRSEGLHNLTASISLNYNPVAFVSFSISSSTVDTNFYQFNKQDGSFQPRLFIIPKVIKSTQLSIDNNTLNFYNSTTKVPDNVMFTADLSRLNINTFATLNNRIITFADNNTITIPTQVSVPARHGFLTANKNTLSFFPESYSVPEDALFSVDVSELNSVSDTASSTTSVNSLENRVITQAFNSIPIASLNTDTNTLTFTPVTGVPFSFTSSVNTNVPLLTEYTGRNTTSGFASSFIYDHFAKYTDINNLLTDVVITGNNVKFINYIGGFTQSYNLIKGDKGDKGDRGDQGPSASDTFIKIADTPDIDYPNFSSARDTTVSELTGHFITSYTHQSVKLYKTFDKSDTPVDIEIPYIRGITVNDTGYLRVYINTKSILNNHADYHGIQLPTLGTDTNTYVKGGLIRNRYLLLYKTVSTTDVNNIIASVNLEAIFKRTAEDAVYTAGTSIDTINFYNTTTTNLQTPSNLTFQARIPHIPDILDIAVLDRKNTFTQNNIFTHNFTMKSGQASDQKTRVIFRSATGPGNITSLPTVRIFTVGLKGINNDFVIEKQSINSIPTLNSMFIDRLTGLITLDKYVGESKYTVTEGLEVRGTDGNFVTVPIGGTNILPLNNTFSGTNTFNGDSFLNGDNTFDNITISKTVSPTFIIKKPGSLGYSFNINVDNEFSIDSNLNRTNSFKMKINGFIDMKSFKGEAQYSNGILKVKNSLGIFDTVSLDSATGVDIRPLNNTFSGSNIFTNNIFQVKDIYVKDTAGNPRITFKSGFTSTFDDFSIGSKNSTKGDFSIQRKGSIEVFTIERNTGFATFKNSLTLENNIPTLNFKRVTNVNNNYEISVDSRNVFSIENTSPISTSNVTRANFKPLIIQDNGFVIIPALLQTGKVIISKSIDPSINLLKNNTHQYRFGINATNFLYIRQNQSSSFPFLIKTDGFIEMSSFKGEAQYSANILKVKNNDGNFITVPVALLSTNNNFRGQNNSFKHINVSNISVRKILATSTTSGVSPFIDFYNGQINNSKRWEIGMDAVNNIYIHNTNGGLGTPFSISNHTNITTFQQKINGDIDTVDGKHFWVGIKSDYDAITTKDNNTLYFIT